jgi:hypothetical protein
MELKKLPTLSVTLAPDPLVLPYEPVLLSLPPYELVAEPAFCVISIYSLVKPLLVSWATAACASAWLSKIPITVCDMISDLSLLFVK